MAAVNSLLVSALLACACYAQPTARLEFEAASVKPSPRIPGGPSSMGCRGGPGTSDPGLFRCENFSLANLINWAYRLGTNQLSVPEWVSLAIFDVNAKVPHGTTPDEFCVMLQNLLVDRFKLTVHHETRELAEYRLAVAKGGTKFKPAAAPKEESTADASQDPPTPKPLLFDEAGYPVCQPGESVTKSTFAGRTRMCEPHTNMQRLAGMLSGYVHAPVIDATGLSGEYAIDLYWVREESPSAGADETSGPTLVEAVQKQLGLRLEKTANGTKDVLVVDHAEKIPTAN